MVKKITSAMLLGFCSLLMIASTLNGEEPTEQQRVSVGERGISLEAQQEQNKQHHKEVAHQIKTQGLPKEISEKVKQKFAAKSVIYSRHPGADHYMSCFTFGDTISLLDGTVWSVAPGYEVIAHGWFPSDRLVITPIPGPYAFKITNQRTFNEVPCNLVLGPYYQSAYTYWIRTIDYYSRQIVLNDGTVWNMSLFDQSLIEGWWPNDTVIIGVNNNALSSFYPNVLINVNTLTYAAGYVY